MNTKYKITALVAFTGVFTSIGLSAQTVIVSDLSFKPVIDGNTTEWSNVPSEKIVLTKTVPSGKSNITSVSTKFGIIDDAVCFVFEWKDSSYDNQHKPFVWNDAKGKYSAGKQREDRLAVQFEMSGDYDSNWLSGNEFTADTWHWKAARSNLLGIAQDKMTVVSLTPLKKAYKGKSGSGSTVYIKRSSDEGSSLYSTKRYSNKELDVMPKYIPTPNPQGSIADVKAKGVWSNGMWSLEGCRQLNTGNIDDVVFSKGAVIKGGIALFNHSGDADHNHSKTISFQF